MIKMHKKEIILFIIIFIISLIICSGFIKMHYTTDTYKIADAGYEYYAVNWSLKDGRIFMYILLMLVNMFNFPIEITNYIFEILAIIISCISIIVIKNVILYLKPTNSLKIEGIVLLISYLSVFNFMYIETLYFLETIIISASILLYTLATREIILKRKWYIQKSLILVLLGIISYQGTISFFIILTTVFLLIKNKKINKEFIKEILIVAIITLLSVIVSFIEVKVICNYLGKSQDRFNLGNILDNGLYILGNMSAILIYTCGLLPKYIFLCSIILLVLLSLIYVVKEKNKNYEHITNILFIIIISILGSFIVFFGTKNSFDCGRMYIGLGALPMLIICYLYCNTTIFDNKLLNILILLTILFFIINSINYKKLIREVQYKNSLEKEYCKSIERYLIEESINIDKAAIIPVKGMRKKIYFNNIHTINSMTINEIRGYESAISGFNINTEYTLTEIKPNNELIQKYHKEIEKGNTGINDSYSIIIDNILIMPAFIW